MKKLFLILLTTTTVFIISCSSSKTSIGSYISKESVEQLDTIPTKYVVLSDDSKVFSKKIAFKKIGTKNFIIADTSKFEISKVNGIQMGLVNGTKKVSAYYRNIEGDFYEEVIIGNRISVFERKTNFATNIHAEISKYCYQKKGGKLTPMNDFFDVTTALADCKATRNITNMDMQDFKDEMKQNKRFLNETFEKYNTKCK